MKEQEFRIMTKEEIENWYKTDFSKDFVENERKPLEDIFLLIKEGRYDLYGLFEDHKFLGYVALWKRKDINLVLIDYLGVNVNYRNKGIGGKILKILLSKNFPIVVESELPISGANPEENQIRERRINFYKRNGFTPVYEMATCGMRWQALIANTLDMDLQDIMHLHKDLYGEKRTDVKIPISKDDVLETPYWMNK